MLALWTELLPLFVVRWLALRYCERVHIDREGRCLAVVARPDVLIKLRAQSTPQPPAPPTETP